jgi:N-acetyl-anhydromuramyl-L-alanine amidase AmpD
VHPITLSSTSTQPASAGPESGEPGISWVGSPNFNNRRRPDDIAAIVIHATANVSLEYTIDRFGDSSSEVSAHYTIAKDGTIVQHVHDMHRAWHAGRSRYKGRQGCDDFTLGVELVNLNDGTDPYPEIQHQVNVELCVHLCQKHGITSDDIIGHLDVAIPPGRKSDPRGYDLNRLRKDVAVRLSTD